MSAGQHLHIDPFSGVSGDMFLGALVDGGLPLEQLVEALNALALPHWRLEQGPQRDHRVGGTRVRVILEPGHDQRARHLADIRTIIERATALPTAVATKSLAIFELLAAAEAEVHGTDIEAVHFHEVGATDAIVDIVGTVLGLHLLGVSSISCGPLTLGSGFVDCQHGRLPVPVPATALLVRGCPIQYDPGEEASGELVTPTGAALVRGLTTRFGAAPQMRLERVAYGLGSRDRGAVPNALRLLFGHRGAVESEVVEVLTTTLDDLDPRLYGPLVDDLFAAGALDVNLRPVYGKKGRPATEVVVLAPCDAALVGQLSELLFKETTTFGLRLRRERRAVLERRWREVQTRYGPVQVKDGLLAGRVLTSQPEFETCASLAQEQGVSVREVLDAAVAAAFRQAAPGAGEAATGDES